MKLKIKISRFAKAIARRVKNHHFGFTLVELLVVVAIMGILSSVSYLGIQEVRKTIRDNKRRADLNEVARALELFKADYGQYPPNNYYSIDAYDSGVGDYLMTFLKEGSSNFVFQYPNGTVTKPVSGGYLSQNIQDPINYYQIGGLNNSYVYVYYGARWSNWARKESDMPDDFPLLCPANDSTTCEDWEDCCNGPSACFGDFCEYNPVGSIITFYNYSMSSIGRLCYGEMSNRAVSVLFARLEKPSKPEERINEVFSFCPTASASHPNHSYFLKLKQLFPKGKDCYNGDDSYEAWGCNTDLVNPISDYELYQFNNYNYFVPLTGEFNLR